MEQELVSRALVAAGARVWQTFARQAVIGAWLATVGAWITDEAIWADCQALSLMQEEVLIDTTGGALCGLVDAREARRITKLALICRYIKVAICRALLDTGVHLEELIGVIRVATETV